MFNQLRLIRGDLLLRRVIEKGIELVKLLLRDWVILVRVALRATDRQSQPNCARRRRTVHGRFATKLFRVNSAFLIGEGLAMKTSRGFLRNRRLGKQVTRQLL